MKPVCVPCERFYRIKKSGFYFQEGMPVGSDRPQPGTAEPDRWKPYKVWSGDLWECPTCGSQIVAGVAQCAISEHWQTDFDRSVEITGADRLLVKDC